jgi:hypothetical protein
MVGVLLLVVVVVLVCGTTVADGAKCPCSDATLCERVQVPPRKEVFAFMVDNSFANWRGFAPPAPRPAVMV